MLTAQIAAGADTLLHSVTGYTSTDNGLVSFTAMVFDDAGKVVVTGGEDLIAEYDDAEIIDGAGLDYRV